MFAIKLLVLFLCIYVSLLILPLVFVFKKDKEIEEEVKRWSNFCESDDNWTSKGRLYSTGLTVIEDKKTRKKRFVKQKKLVDIGLVEKTKEKKL